MIWQISEPPKHAHYPHRRDRQLSLVGTRIGASAEPREVLYSTNEFEWHLRTTPPRRRRRIWHKPLRSAPTTRIAEIANSTAHRAGRRVTGAKQRSLKQPRLDAYEE